MSEQTPPPSVGDMLRQLRGRGMSNKEIAGMLGRSPSMISQIASGKKPGEAYREAVTELFTRGTVSKPPARRRDKAGHVVPVRAKGGGTTVPKRTPGTFTERRTVLPGGARQIEVTAPKTRTAKGREAANAAIIRTIRSAAKGQRYARKRVKFQVTTSDGRHFPVGDKGGYQVSSVLRRTKPKKRKPTEAELERLGEVAAKAAIEAASDFASDALGWLKKQAQHRYEGLERANVTITGITMTIWTASTGE
jgi:hypothetical protein